MKTGVGDLYTVENGFGRVKHENWTTTPSVPPKISPGVQNKESGSVALDIAQNESGSAKHENWTRRPLYRRNCAKLVL
jgi:hypothetical protein